MSMSRNYELTWVDGRKLWRKVFKGRTYTISCRQLGLSDAACNKVGSYQAANAWWEGKKHELDAASRPPLRPLLPLEDVAAATRGDVRAFDDPHSVTEVLFARATRELEEYDRRQAEAEAWYEKYGDLYDPETGQTIHRCPPPDLEAERRAAIRAAFLQLADQWLVHGQPLPEPLTKLLPPARRQQVQDAGAGLLGETTTSPDQTAKSFSDRWLERKKLDVCPDRYQHYVRQMKHFLACVGPDTDVKSFNGRTLDDFYQRCREKVADPDGWSPAWARDTFIAAKAFLAWLVSTEAIEPLRNLNNRFPFDTQPPEPVPWTGEEIRTALEMAGDRLRLFILLALNCGIGQKDITDLHASEVDWTHGTVTRFRSKAKKYKNRRKVSYPLWPSTLDLLKKHNSGQDRVLLSERGSPLQGRNRIDLIGNQFRKLRERIQRKLPAFGRTFYDLRVTGAYLIEEQLGKDLADLYTAHAAKGVTELYYTNALQKRLDEAVTWLGQQLGQVPQDKPAEAARREERRRHRRRRRDAEDDQ
jgi:integrase